MGTRCYFMQEALEPDDALRRALGRLDLLISQPIEFAKNPAPGALFTGLFDGGCQSDSHSCARIENDERHSPPSTGLFRAGPLR